MDGELYRRELQRLQRRMHEIVGDSKADLWERRACSVVVLERLVMALSPSLPREQQEVIEDILGLHWQVW